MATVPNSASIRVASGALLSPAALHVAHLCFLLKAWRLLFSGTPQIVALLFGWNALFEMVDFSPMKRKHWVRDPIVYLSLHFLSWSPSSSQQQQRRGKYNNNKRCVADQNTQAQAPCVVNKIAPPPRTPLGVTWSGQTKPPSS